MSPCRSAAVLLRGGFRPANALRRSAFQGIALSFGVATWCAPAFAQQSRSTPRLSSLLTLSEPELSIGSEDREGPTLFGQIADVALDSALNVYVLDRSVHAVRAFSKTGRFLGAAGKSGRGRGDLASPSRSSSRAGPPARTRRRFPSRRAGTTLSLGGPGRRVLRALRANRHADRAGRRGSADRKHHARESAGI